ncbi:hypothetical protein [Homoserinibacter gongjuensis]|uniref:hypothetical protein n=1 Tax=Homoserinibacter gongjuensis TaxID=1162968 RepID=UPI0032AFF193
MTRTRNGAAITFSLVGFLFLVELTSGILQGFYVPSSPSSSRICRSTTATSTGSRRAPCCSRRSSCRSSRSSATCTGTSACC